MHRMIARGFVSTRLRRWYPLQFRQIARPRYFEARNASFLAIAPAVTVFHGFAFLRGEMTARPPGSSRDRTSLTAIAGNRRKANG
jgi:hypothetical protein